MSVKSYIVRPQTIQQIRSFVENWHYSKNTNGVTSQLCFALFDERKMIGAAIFGVPATPGVYEKYCEGKELTELRRLCCVDDTPKNTESYFIGQMMKWIRDNTDIEIILSYADNTYGHTGIIYKATNFQLIGQSQAVKKIEFNGKLYHDKSLRSKYHGELKSFSLRLIAALECGEAKWVETKPKNIYIFRIRRKRPAKIFRQTQLFAV